MRIQRFRTSSSWKKRIKKFFSKNPKTPWWRGRVVKIFLTGGVLLFLYGWLVLPSVDDAEQLAFSESTIIYDRGALEEGEDPNDHILYVIHGDENREHIPLEEMSPWISKATIAIEDDAFYRHFGFDIGGIAKAVLNEFFGIGSARGGSTLTQQLVKNTFLSRERTISRKFKELLLSVKMEWHFKKDEILELYLNNIPYGSNAYGIEAAAKTFFGKSARELTLAESAVLAGLPVAPTRFSPYGSNKDLLMGYYDYNKETGERVYKKGRKDLVLQRMLDLKMITFEQFKAAWAESQNLEFKRYRTDIKAPHFVFYVREKLEEKYGKEFLRDGGLRIYTTLDPDLQEQAETIIAEKTAHYPGTYGAKNAALVSLNPDNGEILAYVGGKDYFDEENDGQVDVLTSRRQPGSSFKPFVYATAFEKGYNPATVVFDVETDFGGNYKPQNFDGEFLGPVSFREALNRSLNIPAIKAAYLATPKAILELAQRLGILFEGDAERHGVAIGIGVAEVQPLSHINAFQVFTGGGSYYEPSGILRVENSEGDVLEMLSHNDHKREGISTEVAALVRNVLTDESTRPTTDGFDWNKLLQLEGYNNGAKTGTSNRTAENPEFKEDEPEDEEENPRLITVPGDSWTIGFTPHLVTGVWIGNNRGEPMKSGSTGLAVAAPVWKSFMTNAHAQLVERGADPEKLYAEPTLLELRKVNKFSGKLATDMTPERLVKEEVFASFSVPTEIDDTVKKMEVDKISGRPATSYTPHYSRVLKYVLDLKSIRPDMPNWQNPVTDWIKDHPKFFTSLGTVLEVSEDDTEDDFTTRPRESRLTRRLNDDVHNRYTAQNPPRISITYPRNGSTIAPGNVEIVVSAEAKFDMRAVEFYLDDQLMDDATGFPWVGRIRVPDTLQPGSKHLIRVVAIDRLFNTAQEEIEVEIAKDAEGPTIKFLGPIGQERIPHASWVHVLVDVIDQNSGVNVVEFYLDGQSLGFTKTRPFEKNFEAVGELGRHELMVRAWDYYGNMAEKTIPVYYDREQLLQESEPFISKIIPYRDSVTVQVAFPDPETLEWAEIIVEQGEDVIFSRKISTPPKSAEFHIQKNLAGRARIQLYTKRQGQEKIYQSPPRQVDL